MDGEINNQEEPSIDIDFTQSEIDALIIGLRDAGEVNAYRLKRLREKAQKQTLTQDESDLLNLSLSLNETYISLFERLREEYHFFDTYEQEKPKIIKPKWTRDG